MKPEWKASHEHCCLSETCEERNQKKINVLHMFWLLHIKTVKRKEFGGMQIWIIPLRL